MQSRIICKSLNTSLFASEWKCCIFLIPPRGFHIPGETVDVHTTHSVGSTAPPPSQQTPHTSAPPPTSVPPPTSATPPTSVPPPTSATPPTSVPPPTSSPISTSVPVGVEEVETGTPSIQLTTPVTHPPGVQVLIS
ncbi:hypothetical protein AgCh_022379 [Apium graveolens]